MNLGPAYIRPGTDELNKGFLGFFFWKPMDSTTTAKADFIKIRVLHTHTERA